MHMPAPKSRKRSLQFTPPRNAREVVQATQEDEDMELDSLSSQTSHSRRKRLIAPWKLILIKLKSKCTKQEVMEEFAEIAANDLLKAGVSDDYRRSEDALGGFKPAQVLIFTYRTWTRVLIHSAWGRNIFLWPRRRMGSVADIISVHTSCDVPVRLASASRSTMIALNCCNQGNIPERAILPLRVF